MSLATLWVSPPWSAAPFNFGSPCFSNVGSIGIDPAVLATRCDDFLQASGDSASQAVFTGIA